MLYTLRRLAASSVMGQAFTASGEGIVEEQSKQFNPGGIVSLMPGSVGGYDARCKALFTGLEIKNEKILDTADN